MVTRTLLIDGINNQCFLLDSSCAATESKLKERYTDTIVTPQHVLSASNDSYPSQLNDSYQLSSGQSHDRLGRRGDTRDDSVEILFQSFSAGGHFEQSTTEDYVRAENELQSIS